MKKAPLIIIALAGTFVVLAIIFGIEQNGTSYVVPQSPNIESMHSPQK